MSQVKFFQGNEACAEGALAAGCRFFAGYPITPSSEIAEILSKRLPEVGGKFIQMEDEIASMGAILGASLTGCKALTATSGPGFSLKQELIGYASLCEIPCVIVNVQRGGPSTGLPTLPSQGDVMQARWGTHGDHPIIVLSPSSVEEMYFLTIEAFNLSEKFRVPIILLADEIVAHMREKINIPDAKDIEIFERPKPKVPPDKYLPFEAKNPEDVPPLANFGDGYRFNVTGLIYDKSGFPTSDFIETKNLIDRLHIKLEANLDKIVKTEKYNLEDAKIALFSFGATARSAQAAMQEARASGLKVGLLRAITIWPFPEKEVAELAQKVDAILVCEMNRGQLINEVARVAGKNKVMGVNLFSGEPMPPDMILKKIKEVYPMPVEEAHGRT